MEVPIPNLDLNFWNSDPKINFWGNLDRKSKKCPLCLKIGTHGISRMLILIPTLVFCIPNRKSIFCQIWPEKFKVFLFAPKFAHRVSQGCWFLFRLSSKFPTLTPFFGKFQPKKLNCLLCLKADTECLEDVIANIPSKIWKGRQKWLIVLSPCCSYIFIVAEGKTWCNQQENIG